MTGDESVVDLPAAELIGSVAEVFTAAGVPAADAAVVAEDLVGADEAGVRTHGVVRMLEYLDALQDGRIVAGGECRVVTETSATALVDGGGNFGQVAARFALTVATRKAAEGGCAVVVTRNSHHIGRVGALGELAAADGLIALAFVAVGAPGPVAPFGGAEGRLGTNPIAYGVPTDNAAIVADFATAAMPDGAVQRAAELGSELPPGVLVDATGRPSTDPRDRFTAPPGAILPFGGPQAHRGFALNLLVELLGGTLAGYGPTDSDRPSNCLCLVVIDPAAFGDGFGTRASATADFVRAARPAEGQTVQLPGEPEARARAANDGRLRIPADVYARLREIGLPDGGR